MQSVIRTAPVHRTRTQRSERTAPLLRSDLEYGCRLVENVVSAWRQQHSAHSDWWMLGDVDRFQLTSDCAGSQPSV